MYEDEDPPFWDPDALPRILTLAEASARGFTYQAVYRRVRTGRWRHVLPRTFRTGTDITRWDKLDAALSFAGPDALLTGAAALWVDEVRIPFPDLVALVTPRQAGVRSLAWVRVSHSGRTPERSLESGPRRVETARAVADLALTLMQLDDVRDLVARVIREQRCKVDHLVRELETGPRRGSALLRQALTEVGAGAASAPEAEAADILRRAGVPPFEQNAVIRLPDGRSYVADFLWRDLRAILEIDSVEYNFDPADWRRTLDRHMELTTLGFSVVHRPPSALRDRRRFATDVRTWLVGLAAARTA